MTEQHPYGIGTRVQLTQSALTNAVFPNGLPGDQVHTGAVIEWTVVQDDVGFAPEYGYRIDWDNTDDRSTFHQSWIESENAPPAPDPPQQLQVGARVRLTHKAMRVGAGPPPDRRKRNHTGPITGVITHVDNTQMLDGTYGILYRVRWADAEGTDSMHPSWLEQIAPPPQPIIFHPRTRDETTT